MSMFDGLSTSPTPSLHRKDQENQVEKAFLALPAPDCCKSIGSASKAKSENYEQSQKEDYENRAGDVRKRCEGDARYDHCRKDCGG